MEQTSTIKLTAWGWDAAWQAIWDGAERAAEEQPGRVLTVQKNVCRVALEEGELDLGLTGGLLREIAAGSLGVAVGDFVSARVVSGGGVIEGILPRRTVMIRGDGWSATGAQILCANVDILFLVQALGHDFNPRRLERYLAAAWDSGAQPVVLLNKSDIVADPEPWIAQAQDAAPGVDVMAVSAVSGYGLEPLQRLCGTRTCGFLGMSGVGKTTLLNALAGRELAATAAVREDDHRGRHTTTYRELHRLPWGGLLLDTPGMREFSANTGDADAVFSEIAELAKACRFSDCRHGEEPGCAVQDAIRAGSLEPGRLINYHKIAREVRHAERKEAYQRKVAQKVMVNLTDKRHLRKEPAVDTGE